MALYISAGRRQRRLVLTAVAAVVIGLILGIGLGRVSAPKAADQAQAAKQAAGRVTGGLASFPLHYGQAARGEIDPAEYQRSLEAGLRRTDDDLTIAMDDAVWLDALTKQRLRDQITNLRELAGRRAGADEFEAATGQAITTINSAFGTAR